MKLNLHCFLVILFSLNTTFSQTRTDSHKHTFEILDYNRKGNADGYILSDIVFQLTTRSIENAGYEGEKNIYTYNVESNVAVKFKIISYRYQGEEYKLTNQNIFGVLGDGLDPITYIDVLVEAYNSRWQGKLSSNISGGEYGAFKYESLKNLKEPFDIRNIAIGVAKITDSRDSGIENKIEDYLKTSQDNSSGNSAPENTELSSNTDFRENNIQSTSNNGRESSELTSEEKRIKDGQNFINEQNRELVRQNAAADKLASDLTSRFNEISSGWAKEREFQSRIQNLTNITSVDGASIIKETRRKAEQIDAKFGDEKRGNLNETIDKTENYVNSATTKEEAAVGTVVGTLTTIAGQSNLEKQRKEAQEKLRREKVAAIKKAAQPIIDKFSSLKEKYLEAAIYAVQKDEEDYYIDNYAYAKCMEENASSIVTGQYTCDKPDKKKPSFNTQYIGQDYANAYLRKFFRGQPKQTKEIMYNDLKSRLEKDPNNIDLRKRGDSLTNIIAVHLDEKITKSLQETAPYFLELAIDKDPENVNWLFRKADLHSPDIKEKALILKKILSIQPDNKTVSSLLKSLSPSVENNLKGEKFIQILEEKYSITATLKRRYEGSLIPDGYKSLEFYNSDAGVLKLYDLGLTDIPESIGSLNNLIELYLHKNKLTEIPESIGNLKDLKRLELQFNYSLNKIPNSIGNLINLELLSLSGSSITKLPESIGNLKNLKKLYLVNTKLTELPESIGNLINLNELSLYDNDLISLPESMKKLKNLRLIELEEDNKKQLRVYVKTLKKEIPRLIVEWR